MEQERREQDEDDEQVGAEQNSRGCQLILSFDSGKEISKDPVRHGRAGLLGAEKEARDGY